MNFSTLQKGFFVSFLTLILNLNTSTAGDLTCKILDAVRCGCAASMSVDCGSVAGYIDNMEKVKSAVIAYRTASGEKGTLVMTNPTSIARAFYGAMYNEEVKAALLKNGIDPTKTQFEGQSIQVDESTKIYTDPNKTNLASRVKAESTQNEESCTWVSSPQVIKPNGCGYSICIGQMSCSGAETSVSCKAKADGQSCLNAYQCSQDPDIQLVDAKTVKFEGAIRSTQKSSSKQGQ